MNWDIHIYDRATQTTTTKVLFVPETEHRSDVRLAYRHACNTYKVPENMMLALPHNGSGRCTSACSCNRHQQTKEM